jgi:hypothetical protein
MVSCLLIELGYTSMDAGVRRCMRLGMRLPREICSFGVMAGCAAKHAAAIPRPLHRPSAGKKINQNYAVGWPAESHPPAPTDPGGHPPGSSRGYPPAPVLMPALPVTTRQRLRHSSSWSPPDASRAPFPHRPPRQSSANAAVGGLEPPSAGRLRGAKPSSLTQHRLKQLYLIELLSTFVTHVDGG